ncbi:uncharacterized protein [Rutidosis leptorrhynchoides]|uniref:uncharacterized protein n=1 Tax=Rutidosis leptorrhynchoides TaxID=125765 RepID=UPI003A992728
MDRWCQGSILRDLFTYIFYLDENKQCLVIDKWHNNEWNCNRRRPVRGGIEVEQLDALNSLLAQVSCSNLDEKWCWTITSDQFFPASSIRVLLDRSMDVCRNTYWNKVIPSKVLNFFLRLLLNRLPDKKNLQDRNISCSSYTCLDCGFTLEDANHVFFHCPTATHVWSCITMWVCISLPRWKDLLDLMNWLASASPNPKKSLVLHCVCIATLWSIWRFRNDIVFQTGLFKKSYILDNIFVSSFDWFYARYFFV